MDSDERIEQFKNMTEADPENEMGHFSLGRAYFEAGRYAEAEPAFARVLELNPRHSKSYELLGRTLLERGRREDAIEVLQKGHEVAAKAGDVMPRDGMARLLADLGEPVAAAETAAPSAPRAAAGEGEGFRCSRCGRPDGRLERRPFKGELGERILASVCATCWHEWIRMGTKVINELGLVLSDPRAQELYDEHMKEYLQIRD